MKKIYIFCILFVVFLISGCILQDSHSNTLTWTTQQIGDLEKYNITHHYTGFHDDKHVILDSGEKITVSFNTPFSDTEPVFDEKDYSVIDFGILHDYDNWVEYVIEVNTPCTINAKSDTGEFKLHVHIRGETPEIDDTLEESKNLLLEYIKEQNGGISNISFTESKKVEPYHYSFVVLYRIPSDNYTIYGTKAEVKYGRLQFNIFWSEPKGSYYSKHSLYVYSGHKTIIYHILPAYYTKKAKATAGSIWGYIDPHQKTCQLSTDIPDEILYEPIQIVIREDIGLENIYHLNDTAVELIDDYYDSASLEDDFLEVHHHFILKLDPNRPEINFISRSKGTIKCHIPLTSQFPHI